MFASFGRAISLETVYVVIILLTHSVYTYIYILCPSPPVFSDDVST